MTNVDFPSIEYYNEKYTVGKYQTMVESGVDPETALNSLKRTSRDNDRTPMQWNSREHAGFTSGTPWMHVNPNYPEINTESEEHAEKSVLRFYRTLIAMRKEHPIMVYGTYRQILEEEEHLIIYERAYQDEKWLIICNFYGRQEKLPEVAAAAIDTPEKKLLLSNYHNVEEETLIRPYETRIYRIR